MELFAGRDFEVEALTDAINKAPYTPNQLGAMGLFETYGVPTLSVTIEEMQGTVQIIPTKPRGSGGSVQRGSTRRQRAIAIPHCPHDAEVFADEVVGVRKFGTGNQLESVQDRVNDKLAACRQSHELTHEYHRLGAIRGIVVDADGSELLDLFDEFGLTQEVDYLNLGDDEASIKSYAVGLRRKMARGMGGTPFNKIQILCGDTFFDALTEHPLMRKAWDRYQDGAFLRADQSVVGFEYPTGIFWANYVGYTMAGNGTVTPFIPDGEAQAFPVGVPGLFRMAFGPADFVEAVNTIGLPYYAKQEPKRFGKGIDIHTQSNPLAYCTRPKALVQIKNGTRPGG